MQGASPLASPGLNPRGTGIGGEPRARRGLVPVGCQLTLPLWCPAGACPLCHLPPLPFRHPQGGLPFSSPANPAFSLLSCPLSPPAPFPGGEGGDQGYFMQGASPLASPGLNPRGTGAGGVSRAGGVACLSCRLSTLTLAVLLPPIPPARARRALFPGGEGGDQGYFMQGASPLASPGLNPGGTGAGGVSRAGGGACPASLARRALAAPG